MPQGNYVPPTINYESDEKERKKLKLEKIRDYHSQLIKDLDISPLDFNMKMPFYDKRGRYVVGIFASEFKKEKGFFFELITRDLEPLDPERKVYRIARNEHYEEEYEVNERGSYLVLVEDLRLVNPQSVAISKASAVIRNDKIFSKDTEAQTVPNPQPVFTSRPQKESFQEVDALYSEMTIRDYMAIHTGKPVSLKPWLNELLHSKLPF